MEAKSIKKGSQGDLGDLPVLAGIIVTFA